MAISARRRGEQVELALDVAERLVEDLAAAVAVGVAVVPLLAQHAACLLDLEQLLQLVEADAEERLEPQRLAQALDVGVGVEAMAPGLALLAAAGQQPDLLVVADRARGRADELGDLADAQGGRWSSRWSCGDSHCVGLRLGFARGTQQRHARAEDRGGRQHPQRDVHVVDERRQSASDSPELTPEKIDSSTLVGTAAVTIASTNAIDRTEPVFCSIIRVPPAMPRRCAGTEPIIAAVLGELNMPEPRPLISSHVAVSQ